MESLVTRVSGCCLLMALATGCTPDGPDIARVVGEVKMDGKPLPGATVVFIPQAGGRPAVAETDANGNYTLEFSGGREGTIPGVNKVEITTYRRAEVDDTGKPIPGSPEKVPVEYNQSTKLTFDVEKGKKNVADFELKSGGKVMKPPVEN